MEKPHDCGPKKEKCYMLVVSKPFCCGKTFWVRDSVLWRSIEISARWTPRESEKIVNTQEYEKLPLSWNMTSDLGSHLTITKLDIE